MVLKPFLDNVWDIQSSFARPLPLKASVELTFRAVSAASRFTTTDYPIRSNPLPRETNGRVRQNRETFSSYGVHSHVAN